MLEDVTHLGLKGFFTYHFTEGSTFRPCATSDTEEKAISAAIVESQELRMIEENNFSEVFFGGADLGNFVLPIHLHPFMWQRRDLQDVMWYNKIHCQYVPFFHYLTNELKYLPKDLTVCSNRHSSKGLTFSPQEGYSYDTNLELAKIKSAMELIEKDVVTLWWHRETESKRIILDDEINSDISALKKYLSDQNIKITILDLENDFDVYVIVCILEQDHDYPAITYGSAAHFDINVAVKHAIFEAVSCIAGLRYDFIHFNLINNDIKYPNFIENSPTLNLSSYRDIRSLDNAFKKYDMYYTYVSTQEEGYLVKAYSFELQATLYCDTVPLTKRFFKASDKDVVIKNHFPFL